MNHYGYFPAILFVFSSPHKPFTMKPGKLLLIVDDNLNFVKRIVSMLEETSSIRGINIASDYEEAKRIFFSEEHHLVFLDINLPGKSGIELLKLFKEHRKETEVIMITNHADPYYRQQCLQLGAKYFLDKSNDYGRITSLVN